MNLAGMMHKRTARAPQGISDINWSSPLADGLTHAWMPGVGSAASLVDLAGASPLTGTGVPGASTLGKMLVFNGTNDASAVVPIGSGGLTIALWNTHPTITQWSDIAGFSATAIDWIILSKGTNAEWYFYARKSANDGEIDSNIPTTTVPVHLALAIDDLNAGSARLYVNGRQRGVTDGLAQDYRNLTSNFGVGWGGAGRGTSRRTPAAVTGIMVYTRAISAPEAAALYQPRTRWDWLRQPARTYFIPAAAGGGATINVDGGSFSLSGGTISVDKTVDVSGGNYSLTTSAISIDKTIQIGGGSYSVTAGSLSIDKTVDLTGGTLTLTAGNYTALLASGTVVNVDGGTFTLTAGSVDIDKTVSLSGGSFTLTPSAIGLDWNIPVGGGSYTVTVGGVQLDKTQDLSGGLFLITPGGVTWNQLGDEPVAVTKSNQQWKYRRLKGRRRK